MSLDNSGELKNINRKKGEKKNNHSIICSIWSTISGNYNSEQAENLKPQGSQKGFALKGVNYFLSK